MSCEFTDMILKFLFLQLIYSKMDIFGVQLYDFYTFV